MFQDQVKSEQEIKVYYDGLCHLCSREINHYRTMRGSDRINFIDITSPQFSAEEEGLDPFDVHRNLHSKDGEGRVHKGVETFFLIWSQLEATKAFVPFVSKRPIKAVLEGMYSVFVRVRPYLPKKSCQSSPYCEVSPLKK
jgi:predicted DCC family thiol-disulfide oxidoreductase YuxK